ncbi:hypothetical protein TRVL_05035 [Trypanosoma vivax]|nr:hypothetical protein TRVL_05035 [Trypanosoma vivax]
MPARLTLQSSSAWPIGVDFDMFWAYTAGLSVEETLQYMLNEVDHYHDVGETMAPTESSSSLSLLVAATATGSSSLSNCLHEAVWPVDGQAGNATQATDGNRRSAEIRAAQSQSVDTKSNLPQGAFQKELRHVLAKIAADRPFLLSQEIEQQFNLFDMLRENYLPTPYAFLSSCAIAISLTDRRRLVDLYYSVDDEVLKFFLGDSLRKMDLEGESECGFFMRLLRVKRRVNRRRLVEAGIRDRSVKRQWENLKRVCTFVHSAYRGRDGKVIPRTTPLVDALQQCFALRGSLLASYSTFVFCFEHRINGRCCEMLSYTECTKLFSLVASLWCDSSMLMLRASFCDVCSRVARLLDESRVIGEIHQMAFGEAMRPRWQQQLDGVQRAIGTNAGVGGVNNIHGIGSGCASSSSGGGGAGVRGVPNLASAAPLSSGTTTGNLSSNPFPRNNSLQAVEAGSQARVPPPCPLRRGCLSVGAGNSLLDLEQDTVMGSGSSGCVDNGTAAVLPPGSPFAAGPGSAHLCLNGAFSRRFLHEFPYIIKTLVRMAAAIGNSEAVHEALDIFYTRIYAPLESLSQRSVGLQCAEPGGPRTNTTDPSLKHVTVAGIGRLVCNNGDNVATSHTKNDCKGMEEEEEGGGGGGGNAVCEDGLKLHGVDTPTTNSEVLWGSPLNSTASFNGVAERAAQHYYDVSAPISSVEGCNVAPSSSVYTVNSGVYLHELCTFLTLLPNIFSNLSVLTDEDHAKCDADLSNFVLVVKRLLQLMIASRDH